MCKYWQVHEHFTEESLKEPSVDPLWFQSKELQKIPLSRFTFESAVVTAGGEGSNLGLAGSGRHPVISRVGQC